MPEPDLRHGEALEALRGLPDNHADAIVTDPPYSSGGAFRGDRAGPGTSTKYHCDHNVVREYAEFQGDTRDQRAYFLWCTLWLTECLRVSRPGSPCCVFTDWRQLPTTTDALQVAGWVWRGIAVWDKTEGCRPQLGRFRSQCEYIVWGSKGQMPDEGEALPGVCRHISSGRGKVHLAGKPLSIMSWVVRICKPGGLVLDPFMGSGTTGLAALRSGHSFLGVEIDRTAYEQAQRRLAIGSAGRGHC